MQNALIGILLERPWLWFPGSSLRSAREWRLMNLRFGDLRRALQKIEVAAFVGLPDML